MLKVAHLSSVHCRYDTRVFHKMCKSLVKDGYKVSLVIADSRGNETCKDISIHDVGLSKSRLSRILKAPKKIFAKAIALDADLYHLHDPELIPIGLKLKWLGKKVIFDSHEDVPKQLLTKPYLNVIFLRLLSVAFTIFERFSCSRFDAIVAATPSIHNKFLKINSCVCNINNFPILENSASATRAARSRSTICYVGGVTAIRGIRELIRALELVRSDVPLVIAGNFSEPSISTEVRQYPGWAKVDELGFVDHAEVQKVLSRSLMGIVTFLPVSNHIDAQPNKMFEYMSAGIPVVASNFPLWREIIEGNNCGLCVDPCEPGAIAAAIDALAQDPDRAHRMGQNGQLAIRQRYNWDIEGHKLLQLYDRLLKEKA